MNLPRLFLLALFLCLTVDGQEDDFAATAPTEVSPAPPVSQPSDSPVTQAQGPESTVSTSEPSVTMATSTEPPTTTEAFRPAEAPPPTEAHIPIEAHTPIETSTPIEAHIPTEAPTSTKVHTSTEGHTPTESHIPTYITTTEFEDNGLDAVLKEGNPMQAMGGAQEPKGQGIQKQGKLALNATEGKLNATAFISSHLSQAKKLGEAFMNYSTCMGKDWLLRCQESILTCAKKPALFKCLKALECGKKNSALCAEKFHLAQNNNVTQTIPAMLKKVITTTLPLTTTHNPDTTKTNLGDDQDVNLKESMPEVNPTQVTQAPDASREIRRQQLRDRIEKVKFKIRDKVIEGTLIAQDQLKKLKALKDSYTPYMSCMGKDFWDKCKYKLLTCAVIPNPVSCLYTMSCGSKNNKKCKGLLPNAKGNNTQPSIGGVTPMLPIPTQMVGVTTLTPLTTAATGITTTEFEDNGLDAVLKEGNPMQEIGGHQEPAPGGQSVKSSNELEKERPMKQHGIHKQGKWALNATEWKLNSTSFKEVQAKLNVAAAEAYQKMSPHMIQASIQAKKLGEQIMNYTLCMGKEWQGKCYESFVTCAKKPALFNCIKALACGRKNNDNCAEKAGLSHLAQLSKVTQATAAMFKKATTTTTQPPTTTHIPDTTTGSGNDPDVKSKETDAK